VTNEFQDSYSDLCPSCDFNSYSEADDYCEECGYCSEDPTLEEVIMAIDHKALLVKYISHVRDCEGDDFIEHHLNKYSDSIKFTADEIAELHILAQKPE
jgi:hypothetical protein